MTSTLTYSNIKHALLKSASEVAKNEIKDGRLNARSLINRFSPGMRIDVLLLKKCLTLIDEPIIFNEVDVRSRKCFSELKKSNSDKGKLPVGTAFFKEIEEGDTIVVILHEVEP